MAGSPKAVFPVLLIALLSDYPDSGEAQVEVLISQGRVRGTTRTTRNERSIYAFLGLPYAQPPIGQLRFKNPRPADGWNGTFMADKDGHQCTQIDDDFVPQGQEDCLYLNVYTPMVRPSTLYPTMVYIHGGRFLTGNSSATSVGPDYIMDKDVVMVAMNYRLGIFGFLSTGDAEASGNFGLKDQSLALRWVQNNIKAFGGDPKRVTLFGQSAGGVSVNFHVLSDASAGLFHQYIAQSGSSLCFWGYHDIEKYKYHAYDLGNYLKCPTNSSKILIDCLRDVDSYRLVNTVEIFNAPIGVIHTWVPTNEPDLEGAFLTSSPLNLVLNHKMRDYPWMTGDVADGGLLITGHLFTNDTLYDMIAKDINGFLLEITKAFIEFTDPYKLAENVKEFYFKGVDPRDKRAFINSLTDLVSDTGFLFPMIIQVQVAVQRMKNPVYLYSFNYRGTVSKTIEIIKTNDNIGVTHTDDLIYIFPMPPKQFGYPELNVSVSDERIIDIMVDFWTSFARIGKPTSNYTTDPDMWLPYADMMSYLQIGNNTDTSLSTELHFYDKRMHFWAMQLLQLAIRNG